MRQQLPQIEDIQEVTIETLQTAINIMAGDTEKWHPTNRETADHSMPYTAAVALMYGTIEPRHFGEEYWRNPQLLALVQKVKVRVSEEANRRAPEAMLSIVDVRRPRASTIPPQSPTIAATTRTPWAIRKLKRSFAPWRRIC